MKIGIVGDVHWSKISSIITKRGNRFTARLENLIASINWCEQTLARCDRIVYLGDFFDRKDIEAEEATALKEIIWNDKPHYFIVGNHEASTSSLSYKSTDVLNKSNFIIEDKPVKYEMETCDIYMLPYILEDTRKTLDAYVDKKSDEKHTIIFSHNDIKGINYGPILSKEGFEISDIERLSDLFINGHIHNGSFVDKKKKILNLGNISGQNFSENAFEYKHQCCILDTDILQLEFLENPFAFNFYKLIINNEKDLKQLRSLKENAVVSIKCSSNILDSARKYLLESDNIVESRVIVTMSDATSIEVDLEDSLRTDNYMKQFVDFIHDKLGTSEIIEKELSEVCKGCI